MKIWVIIFLVLLIFVSACDKKEVIDMTVKNDSGVEEEITEDNETGNNTPVINVTHLGCVNEACVEVVGDGSDECTNDSNCTVHVKVCSDSDGGKEYDTKGITYAENGKYVQVSDKCEDSNTLTEYYCTGNNTIGSEIIKCTNHDFDVCTLGACDTINSTNTTNTSNSS